MATCRCAEPTVTMEHPTPCQICGGKVPEDWGEEPFDLEVLLPAIDKQIEEGGGWANMKHLPGGQDVIWTLIDRGILEEDGGYVRRRRRNGDTIQLIPEGEAAEQFVREVLVELGVETAVFDADDDASFDIIDALALAGKKAGFQVLTGGNEIYVREKPRPTKREDCPIAYHDHLKSDPELFRQETIPGGMQYELELGHCKRCGSTIALTPEMRRKR